jgi:hypothetical protein
MMLVELDCLKWANLKDPVDLSYEVHGRYYKRRRETVRAMQDLFQLETGMPKRGSTILCGSVTCSAPLMLMGNAAQH